MLAGFLLSLVVSPAAGQVADPRWHAEMAVGYWYAQSDLNDFYSSVLDSYRQRGIPIKLQSKFGKTFSLDGGLLFSRIASVQIGVSAGFRYSPAYSGYEDFAGSLNVNGSISSLVIGLVMHGHMTDLWGYPIILTFEPAAIHSSVELTATTRFTSLPQYSNEIRWSGSSWGVQFRALLGTFVPVGPFLAGLHAGYQRGTLRVTNGSPAQSSLLGLGSGLVIADQGGPVVLLRLGFNL
jgi:hypothetical protein